ncbi:hypothetical protein [Desulfovibrio sp. TomC]|uniref:hypothetical protein n=1 Tax=Desulfovibrio sp. TomC TaxID=1562888 RepID=UPI000573B805|nr:hypothetical protein [Desulfovibrio sp. TomC]KHK03387.1 hypothetical protein NY78_0972 [Desulfovibrio sp. TomC]
MKGNALTTFFIKHSLAIFVIATACCLSLIVYFTNSFKPNVLGTWMIVGILTSLLFSGVALVVILAVAAVEKARKYIIAYQPQEGVTLKGRYEKERIRVSDFFSAFLLVNENITFENCEIQGPGSIYLLENSDLDNCTFKLCDWIVVKGEVTVNTAAHFRNTDFLNCNFFNVAIYMSQETANRLCEKQKACSREELSIIGR